MKKYNETSIMHDNCFDPCMHVACAAVIIIACMSKAWAVCPTQNSMQDIMKEGELHKCFDTTIVYGNEASILTSAFVGHGVKT